MPLVLGVLEGDGDEPGVLFDAHYDTVHARPEDWSRDPWGAAGRGRRALRARRRRQQGLARRDARRRSRRSSARASRAAGPIFFMSDSDGEDGFRGATLMADLGVIERVGTIFSAEATSNHGHRDRLPRHLDLEAHRRRAHRASDRAREGHQRDHEDGEARRGRRRRAGSRRRAGTSRVVRAARDDPGDPHPAGRRLDDPRALRRGAVGDVARRARRSTRCATRSTRFLRDARARGRRGALRAQGAADGGRPPVAAAGGGRPRAPGRPGARGRGAGGHRPQRRGAEVQRRLGRCRRADAHGRARLRRRRRRSRSVRATSSRRTRSTSTSPIADVAEAGEMYARAARALSCDARPSGDRRSPATEPPAREETREMGERWRS